MDFQRVFILLGLAVTSYLLVLEWNNDYGQRKDSPDPKKPEKQIVVNESNDTPELQTQTDIDGIPEVSISGPVVKTAPMPEEDISHRINVKTDVLDLDIDLLGGDIKRIALPKFPETLEDPEKAFVLMDYRNSYVAQSGLIGENGTDKDGTRPRFYADKKEYSLGFSDGLQVELVYDQEDGTEIRKIFGFRRGDYLVDIVYEIRNRTDELWSGAFYAQLKRDGQKPVGSDGNFMGMQPYVGGATRTEDDIFKKIDFEDLDNQTYRLTRTEGYMAMVQHYFLTAWAPPSSDTRQNYYARRLGSKDIYLLGYTSEPVSVERGEVKKISTSFYAGPKDQYRLQEIATGLDLTVDYGFLWWLSQPLFYMLTYIHGLVGNWGLAIIGLTLLVKILLWPLSASGYRSMAKMRKLSPEMNRLKERHGDDRQAFSQAMMELYKKEGTNPLGGCFPILLQMPVFLALYWTLMESVELRQAPFILWIKDLSVMDPYFVLPILMGITMYLTQRMQPEPPDPVQAAVFKYMPIMFTFLFLWFPSGLVLYWLINNILSILQQWYVTRQLEKT